MSERNDDPWRRLSQQLTEYVEAEVVGIQEYAVGDSPIEKLFYGALLACSRFADGSPSQVVVPCKSFPKEVLLASCDPGKLIVEPQAQLEGWRVDFLLHAWEFGRLSGRPQWRRLIVECDGHDYHERTKEQAARDRSRDRDFQLRGYTVLRFTGRELHRDPLGCARQVSEWVEMGW